ncbi:MAG: calcium-translocating P-type ATPase, SERCA-type [bacterium]|nr:calcium-translocating P-type ATPase, SERCA-type [bacterium]
MNDLKPYAIDSQDVLAHWGTAAGQGLKQETALQRLLEFGENKISEAKTKNPWLIFFGQFNSFIIYVLFGACLVSAGLGEWIDALAILAIVIINSVLGFIQEYKAERSLKALKNLSAPTAKVRRAGQIITIQATKVVPGDILVLDSGDRIAADARIIESVNLRIDESILTGESHPVEKDKQARLKIETPLAERRNMVYSGSNVVYGRGQAVVVATGMKTEFGNIAHLLQTVEKETTPLMQRLEKVGRLLVYVCLGICVLVFALGVWRGGTYGEMLLTAVSLAVAAIPEGLPAIVTVVLALGVQRMAKRNALVRKLPAVETLGCTSVICTDKTGTLTQNKMMVRKIFAGGDFIELTGSGYDPQGNFLKQGKRINANRQLDVIQSLRIAVLCNNAQLNQDEKNDLWQVTGDPTEGALLAAAAKAGIWRKDLEQYYEYIDEIPFDSAKKRMSVLYRRKETGFVFTKGSPENILERCDRICVLGKINPLTIEEKEKIRQANSNLATQALRVLAVAYKEVPADQLLGRSEKLEEKLVFVGLLAMIDPPRLEVKDAVNQCKKAGIKVIMITGDQKDTAVAIARELGILDEHGLVLDGTELEAMSEQQLAAAVDKVQVYARTASEHKLIIIKALKAKGYVIAMTGDGVNDAPAIKEADIGMAMGITGTDVTKEAADMILLDDNFSTIVRAVEEGRGIYANIKRFVGYLLSCNFSEVMTMLGAGLIGLPVPLLPIQILWINLVTDGFPALALGVEPTEQGVMSHRPRQAREKLLTRRDLANLIFDGSVICIVTVTSFVIGQHWFQAGLGQARTMAFSTLVLAQLVQVFNCRSWHISLFKLGFFSNTYLVYAVFLSIVMQVSVLYVPVLQRVFKTEALALGPLAVILALAFVPLLLTEALKIKRRRNLAL